MLGSTDPFTQWMEMLWNHEDEEERRRKEWEKKKDEDVSEETK